MLLRSAPYSTISEQNLTANTIQKIILFSATHRNISPDEEEMIENICHEIRQGPTKDDFNV